ncbi:MAG TPA: OmpA family protein, partial [Rectinemataceae bacterium]
DQAAKQAAERAAAEQAAKQAAEKAAAEKEAAAKAASVLEAKVTAEPKLFSPDGDGNDDTMRFILSVESGSGIVEWKLDLIERAVSESTKSGTGQERVFMSWEGKGAPPSEIQWNGVSAKKELVQSATDYPFKLTVKDKLGQTKTSSGVLSVDVLVLKDGNNLVLKVPSIVFRSDNADFKSLSADIVANNEEVIARIAQILNKFPEYNIKIQGHANSASKIAGLSQAKIQAEETKELIPLSLNRAKMVMSMLIQNGVDKARLTAEGLGSSKPVVSFSDAQNRWKNRRVEFILIKKK